MVFSSAAGVTRNIRHFAISGTPSFRAPRKHRDDAEPSTPSPPPVPAPLHIKWCDIRRETDLITGIP